MIYWADKMGKETVSWASVSDLSKIRHSIDKCSR